ncbi:hypothetical protein WDU94_006188 [Cyamophila willieti]
MNSEDKRLLESDILRIFDETVTDIIGQVDVNLLRSLSKLIVERRTASSLTDEEYLEQKLETVGAGKTAHTNGDDTSTTAHTCRIIEGDQTNVDMTRKDILFQMYLTFRTYENAIRDIVYEYEGDNRRLDANTLEIARIIIYLLIFHLKHFNINKVKSLLVKFNSSEATNIVKFLSSYDLYKTMCRYFDKEHVVDTLKVKETKKLLPKLKNQLLPKKVIFIGDTSKSVSRPSKSPTVKPAKPDLCDPCSANRGGGDQKIVPVIKRKKIQYTRRVEKKNKTEESGRLDLKKEMKIKTRKVQNFQPVAVKTNTAQTLREAAIISKEEDRFEKMIQSLTNGSLCSLEYENYIEELRKQKELEELENIERRKLQALITHEEAILAKKRLIEKNKLEKVNFCKEWEEYEKKMNEIREKEMEELKLQLFVETKQREKNIQDKMKNMIDEKAKLVQEDTKKFKEEQDRRMAELCEDLLRKKELVRQIRLLQEIAKMNNENRVVFDETEVMNNGLMQEMSLAELKQRLHDMEIEIKEELEQKKCEIMNEKLKKQKFLEDSAKLVEVTRNAKREIRECQKEMKQNCQPTLSSSANMDLKMKLMQIRQERLALESAHSLSRLSLETSQASKISNIQ